MVNDITYLSSPSPAGFHCVLLLALRAIAFEMIDFIGLRPPYDPF